MTTGTFPDTWKCAMIRPLMKNINAGTVDLTYRPVFNLKYFSKILERLALKQVVDHCESNELLPNNQSAYRKGFSCETMLLKLADEILNGIEEKSISALVALDLSAAFDACNHKILLETFQNYYGIDEKVISWVTSYLRGRSCVVNVNGKTSKPKQLPWSVPQGSCSGAFYYLICFYHL